MDFRVHNHTRQPTDYDGIQLMLRLHTPLTGDTLDTAPSRNWSTAGRLRRYGPC